MISSSKFYFLLFELRCKEICVCVSEHACAHMSVCWEQAIKELPVTLLVPGWSMTKENKN